MTEREANRTNVGLDDCSAKRSADKTGLEENRNKARARTFVRNQAGREEQPACQPAVSSRSLVRRLKDGWEPS